MRMYVCSLISGVDALLATGDVFMTEKAWIWFVLLLVWSSDNREKVTVGDWNGLDDDVVTVMLVV